MDKLKSCPFCNGTHSINVINFFTRDSFRKCDICGAEAPEAKTPEEAAEKWNTRPAEDALNAENDQLKEALRGMCELWDALGKQIPPLLNERSYLHAKAFIGTGTDVPTKVSEVKDE